MKFLLVGFAENAQNALEILITREFLGCSYHSVPRHLSSFLYPVFPQIPQYILQQSDICVIDLDGIGMMSFDEKHKEPLLQLIDTKPTILISRHVQTGWTKHVPTWTSTSIEYVEHPYSKATITDAFNHLLNGKSVVIVDHTLPSKAKVNYSKNVEQETLITEQKTSKTTQINGSQNVASPVQVSTNIEDKSSKAVQAEVPITQRTRFAKMLLEQRWNKLAENPVLNQLLTIFSEPRPFKLIVSQHEALIFPERNMVLVNKLQSIVDYFSLLNGFQLKKFNIEARLIDDDYKFVEKEYLKNGYKPYHLSLFLWQIYQETLPEHLEINNENLSLKVKYMPDFSDMKNVPIYMTSVLSSCLNQPKHFAQLKKQFELLNIYQLNRVFILSILCNYAEIKTFKHFIMGATHVSESLSSEIKIPKQNESVVKEMAPTAPQQNKQVVKARQMGLLQQLLKKLNL